MIALENGGFGSGMASRCEEKKKRKAFWQYFRSSLFLYFWQELKNWRTTIASVRLIFLNLAWKWWTILGDALPWVTLTPLHPHPTPPHVFKLKSAGFKLKQLFAWKPSTVGHTRPPEEFHASWLTLWAATCPVIPLTLAWGGWQNTTQTLADCWFCTHRQQETSEGFKTLEQYLCCLGGWFLKVEKRTNSNEESRILQTGRASLPLVLWVFFLLF